MSKTIATVAAAQEQARTEVLGPVDGPCCKPEEGLDPCLTCLPDDEAAERLAWTREYEARILAERMADPSPCPPHRALAAGDIFPDDVAYEPSTQDEIWYQNWLAENDGEVRPGRSFAQKIADICNLFRDSEDEAVRFVGEHVGKLHDLAVFLGATSPESFADRHGAMLDAARDAAEARAAMAAR